MNIIKRKEAKKAGLMYYCNGKPCKHGNIAPRLTSNSHCKCEECKQESKMVISSFKRVNRDKYNLYEKLSRERNPEQHRQRQNRFKERNPEKKKAYQKKYSENNKEKAVEWYLKDKEKNPDKYKERNRKAYIKHKDNFYKNCVLYRRRSRQSTPKWEDGSRFSELVGLAREMRDATGFDWDIDHCIPLKAKNASGLNCFNNLQVIPASMNRKKGNRMVYTEPYSWLEDYKGSLFCPVMV
jgi:hypothetical protein